MWKVEFATIYIKVLLALFSPRFALALLTKWVNSNTAEKLLEASRTKPFRVHAILSITHSHIYANNLSFNERASERMKRMKEPSEEAMKEW